jgi:predicted TIM-barrel fold metal-dependent hydrolase
LDIPAYKDHGVWVNSVHAQDMPTMYDNVSSVTNAEMVMPEDKALSVATREANKSPFAVIKGGWNPMSEEEAVAKATEYLNHPDWVQVGIDPERHGYYYNRATMEPIVKAEEVIQIGPLVLAKNPTIAPKEAFKYAMGGAITGDDLILKERPL